MPRQRRENHLTSALEVSHIIRYTNRRILYFTLLYFTGAIGREVHVIGSRDVETLKEED